MACRAGKRWGEPWRGTARTWKVSGVGRAELGPVRGGTGAMEAVRDRLMEARCGASPDAWALRALGREKDGESRGEVLLAFGR